MTESFKVPSIDYTTRDYESIRTDMIALIPFFTSEWTDHNPSDLGIVKVELFSYAHDVLHWYIDRMRAEGQLKTAVTETSILNHLRLIDYAPLGPAAAVGDVTFTVPSNATTSSDYVIPKGTQISTGTTTATELIFETDFDLIVPKGLTTGVVTVTQGKTIGNVAPNGEALGTSDGTQFQKFTLVSSPVLVDSMRIWVDEGGSGTYREYVKVLTFSDELATARVYREVQEDNGNTSVLFGDGINGKIPPSGSAVQAQYRVGGGGLSNVGAGAINVVVSTLPEGVVATVTNTSSMTGGRSKPTLNQLREQGPLDLRALRRAVNLEDYKALARQIASIETAAAEFLSNQQAVLLAVSTSTGAANSVLKKKVKDTLDPNDVLGTGLQVVDPTFVNIDMTMEVIVESTASRSTVEAAVDAAITAYTTIGVGNGQADFGRDVYSSDLCALIDNLEGVDHVDFTQLTRQATYDFSNWKATDATISVAVGDENLIEQTFTITLASVIVSGQDVEYTVFGTVTGTELTKGTAKFDDGTGSNAVSFKPSGTDTDVTISVLFSAAGTGQEPGPLDSFEVKVGKYNGNQTISAREIRQKGTIQRTVTGGVA